MTIRMKHTLLLALAAHAWGAKNLVTTPNGVGTVTLKSPLNITPTSPVALIYAIDRFHTQPADSAPFIGTGPAPYLQAISLRLSGGMLQCINSIDNNSSGIPQADIRGWEEYGFSAVCERNPDGINGPNTGHLTLRVCRMDGSHCITSSMTAAFGSTTLSAMSIGRSGYNPGANGLYGDVALIGLSDKLYGSSAPPNASNAPTGNRAHWSFDASSLSDSVGGAVWSLDWGAPAYTDTRPWPPVCSAGPAQTFSTAAPGQLRGTAWTLNGDPNIEYWWDQTSGPSPVAWSGQNTINPTFTGHMPGEYGFRLQIKDSRGAVAPCAVSDGATSTDSRGILLIGNPVHAKFFSANPVSKDPGTGAPAMMAGAPAGKGINAYPYWTSQAQQMADVVLNASTLFPQDWNNALSGTISVAGTCWDYGQTGNCMTVTGIGTKFRTDFCNADGSIKPERHIVIWYPSTLYPGKTGRRMMDVTSCASDTQLTLKHDFSNWGVVDANRTANMQYAIASDHVSASYWGRNQATAAYYDNAVGLLYMYYATGRQKYLDGFRYIVNGMWSYPLIDRGSNYNWNTSAGGWLYSEARNHAVTSFMMLAADQAYNNGLGSDMWVGIRRIVEWDRGANFHHGSIGDLRNAGFTMQWMALLSLLDPDANQRAYWWQKVKEAHASSWEPIRVVEGNQNYWIAEDATCCGQYSFGGNPLYHGKAHVTQGSNVVSGSGTNFRAVGTDGNGCFAKRGWIWFAPTTASAPLVNFKPQGERYAYRIDVQDSDTQLHLMTPYAGATGDRNYGCAGDSDGGGGSGTLAYGVQPFMLAIAGDGFLWAREAALLNNDSVLTAAFRDYTVGIGYLLKDRAYSKNYGGNTYWTVSPTAETPDEAHRCYTCIANYPGDIAGARVNLVESFRALMYLWRFVPSDALAQEIDLRMGKMWGKPGTGGLIEDPHYVSEAEGFWTIMTPPDAVAGRLSWKWFGYMVGTGANWTWLASRVGGLITATQMNTPAILAIVLLLLLIVFLVLLYFRRMSTQTRQ